MENILSVAGSNSKYKVLGNESAGFWAGLWHGMIAPVTFLEHFAFYRRPPCPIHFRVFGGNGWDTNEFRVYAISENALVSLFVDGVSIYETHNNGRWYEFGFLLGIGAFSGGADAQNAYKG